MASGDFCGYIPAREFWEPAPSEILIPWLIGPLVNFWALAGVKLCLSMTAWAAWLRANRPYAQTREKNLIMTYGHVRNLISMDGKSGQAMAVPAGPAPAALVIVR